MLFDRDMKSGGSRSVISLGGRSFSDGLLGLGGGSLLSLLFCRDGAAVAKFSREARKGFVDSFCKRSRKASIPSACSDVVGSGGRVLAPLMPGFGREGRPMLRFEYAELRDAFDVTELRCFGTLLLLAMLSCVPILLCPSACPSSKNGFVALDVLGLRSAVPSNGPGAMLFMRLVTFSPPSNRGLSGANRGLG
jgi:hypothetical protein